MRGLTPQELYVPPDIESTWRTARCQLRTEWTPPDKLASNFSHASSQWSEYSGFISALCGRGKKKNTPKEIGCTSSHLLAMRQAIYSPTARSRYALVVEDDVFFAFDIDYEALARSAPEGFGILQLFNSNEASMQASFAKYEKDRSHLWSLRNPARFDVWSTCAYLIDRVVMRPVIDAVLSVHEGWMDFKIVAGLGSPCVPRECCVSTEASPQEHFELRPPCVLAPRGYQADSFLYAMTKTYALSVPCIANGLGGNQSTFHQDHVEMLHRQAFRRQRTLINRMKGELPPPAFMRPACEDKLDVDAI